VKKKRIPYKIIDNYYLRTPLLPIKFYEDFLNTPSFERLLENKIFIEALYLASPTLYKQVISWKEQKLKDPKKIKHLECTILKYVSRISTRCTPFGLFAGCVVGKFDTKTNIQLNKIELFDRFTKFDMSFLTSFKDFILNTEIVRNELLFYPNNSLYKTIGDYRYVEYHLEENNRTYSLQEIDKSHYIDKVVNESIEGKRIDQLAEILVCDEISKKDALEFIKELINNQILTSEVEPTITGKDYFEKLILLLKKFELPKINNKLWEINLSLNKLDQSIGCNVDEYFKIQKNLKDLKICFNEKALFHIDTHISTKQNSLSYRVKKDLQKSLMFFNYITPKVQQDHFEKFKSDFINRYENEEISLNIVLDAEIGISYGQKKDDYNSILENLITPRKIDKSKKISWSEFDNLLLEKFVETVRNSTQKIQLELSDFSNLELDWRGLPDTFSALIEVYKDQKEDKIFIDGVGGSTATTLLGRFAYNDIDLRQYTEKIIFEEEKLNEDKILAEIIHLPQSRAGNILHRYNFRKYEIPYLGESSAKRQNQIPVSDIMVSVKNNRIVLRSKKLNKEIKPILSNAHNYSFNSLPIYKFLCDLQSQNQRNLGFSWNPIFYEQSYLPRVEFDNIIISKARWRILVKDYKENSIKDFKNWKINLRLPDYVQLVEGDNKLLICLIYEYSINMLLQTIKNKEFFILEEFLFSEDEIVKQDLKSYCNQFVVSFVKSD
jgi:class I lanthipeptide synthase